MTEKLFTGTLSLNKTKTKHLYRAAAAPLPDDRSIIFPYPIWEFNGQTQFNYQNITFYLTWTSCPHIIRTSFISCLMI